MGGTDLEQRTPATGDEMVREGAAGRRFGWWEDNVREICFEGHRVGTYDCQSWSQRYLGVVHELTRKLRRALFLTYSN